MQSSETSNQHQFINDLIFDFIASHARIVLMDSFVRSFVRSFVHSFVRLFIRSFVHSFVHSFVRSIIRSFVHSFVCSFVHSFNHSFVHSFVRSSVRSLNYVNVMDQPFMLFNSLIFISWYFHWYSWPVSSLSWWRLNKSFKSRVDVDLIYYYYYY